MQITIGGLNGAGKSTVARLLASRLGYDYFYMGMEFRKQAEGRKMTIKEFDDYVRDNPKIDIEMDKSFYSKLKDKDNIVVDSRAGWYFIPRAFSVFLTAPLEVRGARIAGNPRFSEKQLDKDEAMKELQERQSVVSARLRKLYGIEVYDSDNYDLIIDTSDNTPEDIVDLIVQEIKS